MNHLNISQKHNGFEFIDVEGPRFAMASDHTPLSHSDWMRKDGIIIQSDRPETALSILKKVRAAKEPAAYLKPIFIQSSSMPEQIVQLSDGLLDEYAIRTTEHKCIQIINRIKTIRAGCQHLDHSQSLVLKTLQYIYTRQQPLAPFRDRTSKIGYSFPFLSSFIDERDHLELLNLLQSKQYTSFFNSKMVDKVNHCSNCQGTYLNFREVCSSCGSLELSSENMIHHFRCAYIGPESDFVDGADLACPKCNKSLRHIGIDYDKPSEMSHCKSCNHQAQDVVMKASCVDCGQDMDLEQIASQDICHFSITEQGEQLATHGFATSTAPPNSQPQHLNQNYNNNTSGNYFGWSLFKILVRQELERSASGQQNTYLGEVRFREAAFSMLSEKSKEVLQKELLSIIGQYLRPDDIISTANFSTYAFLMPNCDQRLAAQMKEVITYNLKKLIGDNIMQRDEMFMIEVDIRPLNGSDSGVLSMFE